MKNFIHQVRHRYEWLLFTIATFLTVSTFIVMLALSFYKEDTLHFMKQQLISEYQQDNPKKAAEMTDQEILEALPEDDRAMLEMAEDSNIVIVSLIPVGLLLLMIYSIGKIYGNAHANGIKITPHQFPIVHQLWVELAKEVGLQKTPDLFVQNGNGTLNAFATCIPGYRSFGVIYSDILERVLANNDHQTLRFILGHELGHIRLGHVRWWYFLCTFLANMPIINYVVGLPLSRAREYGCDKIGAYLSGDEVGKGLLILAAGKHLYQQVEITAYQEEHITKHNAWSMVSNFFADHPNIN